MVTYGKTVPRTSNTRRPPTCTARSRDGDTPPMHQDRASHPPILAGNVKQTDHASVGRRRLPNGAVGSGPRLRWLLVTGVALLLVLTARARVSVVQSRPERD